MYKNGKPVLGQDQLPHTHLQGGTCILSLAQESTQPLLLRLHMHLVPRVTKPGVSFSTQSWGPRVPPGTEPGSMDHLHKELILRVPTEDCLLPLWRPLAAFHLSFCLSGAHVSISDSKRLQTALAGQLLSSGAGVAWAVLELPVGSGLLQGLPSGTSASATPESLSS